MTEGTSLKLGRFLILDDDVALREALCDTLAAHGYETVGLSSPRAALAQLQDEEFDVLLTDLRMPEMDGLEVLRAALQIDGNLVAVMMTGQGTIETAVEAMRIGAFDHIQKPFQMRELLPVLARALDTRRLRLDNMHQRQAMSIYELCMAVTLTLNPHLVLNKMADAAVTQCLADEVSIMLANEECSELCIVVARGPRREHLLNLRAPIAQGVAGWVAQNKELINLYGPVTDPRFLPLRPRAEIRASVSLPMVSGSKFMGVLNVNAVRRRAFSQGDIKVLQILASIAATALEQVGTHAQLQQSNLQLQIALEQVRAAQDQMVQQERLRALGQMASGIAHDFNNALNPIVGYSDLLLMRPERMANPDLVKEYIQNISAAARDAASVVSRLREFYRKREEGEVLLPVALNPLVAQAVALTQPRWKDQALAQGRTIRVETELADVPLIGGNESELREALTNLIFNAVDAMPEGGTITIRTRAESDRPDAATGGRDDAKVSRQPFHPITPSPRPRVVLSVADTGTGMTEELRQRCVEPFFSTKGEHGTGLGLSMVAGIVDRHDGALDIRSAPGAGSTFTIRLPVLAADRAADAPNRPDPGRPLRILLVDDEENVRLVVADFLTADGHQVTLATNGRDGLEQFQAGAFDLVITDRAMPELNGDGLAAAILDAAPETPVLMLTGYGQLMSSAHELPPGVRLVISKPVTSAALRSAIAGVGLA